MRHGHGRATAILVALALAACLPQQVVLPSPSPATPSPTVSQTPSPSPTPSPTVEATVEPTPQPTPPPPPTPPPCPPPETRAAGEQLLPYYFQTRGAFPIFPSAPQIDLDASRCEASEAQFRGSTPLGIPIFTVRENFVMTPRTAYHEIGHAYEELLKRRNASVDVRAKYWTFRGFPGTWQEAAQLAASQPPGLAQWVYLPGESWAEAFSIAMIGSGREKTLDYGRTINPAATKAFFQSLLTSP